MKILTVVKLVPDSNATIKIESDGSGIITAGLKFVADPFDMFGVILAVELREKGHNVEEIVAITLGPDKAADALRTALAVGADRAIHINDEKFESKNELFSAYIISEAVKKQGDQFDLVVCGKHNIDLDSGAFGPALAEYLDLPHVGAVQGFELEGDKFTARRRIEGAEEVVECSLPAMLTVEKGLVEDRFPSLPNLMKAKKKPVQLVTSADIPGEDASQAGTHFDSMSPPPPRPDCKFLEGEPADMAAELVKLLREEAKVI